MEFDTHLKYLYKINLEISNAKDRIVEWYFFSILFISIQTIILIYFSFDLSLIFYVSIIIIIYTQYKLKNIEKKYIYNCSKIKELFIKEYLNGRNNR